MVFALYNLDCGERLYRLQDPEDHKTTRWCSALDSC